MTTLYIQTKRIYYSDDHCFKKGLVEKIATAKNGVLRYRFGNHTYEFTFCNNELLREKIDDKPVRLRFHPDNPVDPLHIFHLHKDNHIATYTPGGRALEILADYLGVNKPIPIGPIKAFMNKIEDPSKKTTES